jgi:hypothetical protein
MEREHLIKEDLKQMKECRRQSELKEMGKFKEHVPR